MAKGSLAKEEVYNKIKEIFPSSFMYNDGKELRINVNENGELIQLKLTLTASKTIVEGDSSLEDDFPIPVNQKKESPASARMTEKEQEELSNLMKTLNL